MIRIFLEDIKIAKSNGAYLSALALALTIPDILGKIQYHKQPNMENRDKYAQWFNDWVFKYLEIPKGQNKNFIKYDEMLDIDGGFCYSLRCAFLHEGKNLDKYNKNSIRIDKFELCISESEWQFGDGYGCQISNEEIVETHRRINVSNLIDCIISGTEDYLKQREYDLEKYEMIKIIKI